MRGHGPITSGRTNARRSSKLVFAVAATALYAARCNLPNGEENLPLTGVKGVDRAAVIRVLAPPSVRRIGQTVPVTIDVELAEDRRSQSSIHCIRLSSWPGSVTFPLGDTCPSTTMSMEGGSSGSSASMGGSSAGSSPSAGGNMGDAADRTLSTAESCMEVTAIGGDRFGGVEIGAYLPVGDETSATLFAAVYGTIDCSGRALATTAELMQLRGEDDGGGGASGAGPAPTTAGGTGGEESGGVGGMGGSSGAAGAGASGMDGGGDGGDESGGAGGIAGGGGAGGVAGGSGGADEGASGAGQGGG